MRSHSIIKPTLLLLALLTLMITGCATSSAAGQSSGTTSANPTATPIVVDGVHYMIVTDPMFGFKVDIPAGLSHDGQQTEAELGGDVNVWNGSITYHAANETLTVNIGAATKGIAAGQCQAGTPVPVSSGITGYEQDGIFPNPASEAPPQPPFLGVHFVSQGVYVDMSLTGATPRDTFLQRYGAIWQHMLASFTPGAYTNPHPVCS